MCIYIYIYIADRGRFRTPMFPLQKQCAAASRRSLFLRLRLRQDGTRPYNAFPVSICATCRKTSIDERRRFKAAADFGLLRLSEEGLGRDAPDTNH